jgi:hypothetical protein
MEFSPEKIAETVAALRGRAGLSMERMAKAMGYKTASGYQRYEEPATYTGGFANPKVVRRMESALVGKGEPPVTREEVWEIAGPEFGPLPAMTGEAGPLATTLTPGRLESGRKTLPLYAAAMGGDGHVIITFDPIEYIERPAALENVSDGYSVYVVGDSMVPAYRPGETAFVNPRLPPIREADVVLFHVPPANAAECMIKQLNNWNHRDWTLEQFNPATEFTASRVEWPVCHRVIGKLNRK